MKLWNSGTSQHFLITKPFILSNMSLGAHPQATFILLSGITRPYAPYFS